MTFGSVRIGLRDRIDKLSKKRVLLLLGLTALTPSATYGNREEEVRVQRADREI